MDRIKFTPSQWTRECPRPVISIPRSWKSTVAIFIKIFVCCQCLFVIANTREGDHRHWGGGGVVKTRVPLPSGGATKKFCLLFVRVFLSSHLFIFDLTSFCLSTFRSFSGFEETSSCRLQIRRPPFTREPRSRGAQPFPFALHPCWQRNWQQIWIRN